tara:strand:+ start:225 stop:422 length:198 start_codon:yes stop_codon:yes gene_type:complete
MLVAVIDINIVATTGADLNHLVRNIVKVDFIIFYTITDELLCNTLANRSNAGRFHRTKTLNAIDL